MISAGDTVRISDDRKMVKILQQDHGGWNDGMIPALGKIGRVQLVYPDKDIRVKVAGMTWTFNPKVVTKVASGETEDSDDDSSGSAEPLALLLKLLVAAQVSGGGGAQMIKAAVEGESSKVDQILRKGDVDVNEQLGDNEITALHAASGKGHINVIKVLAKYNVNLELSDSDGDRAIHHAALGEQIATIRFLHQSGASLNVKNKKGLTALHIGIHKNSIETVKCLLDLGCHPNTQDAVGDTPLHDAIVKNQDSIVTLLLDNRADMTITNNKGFTAFHHAALKGNVSIVRILLSKLSYPGLVDEKKEDGFTALHLAAMNDHVKVAELLLRQGKAKVNIQNVKLQTPLHLAVRSQKTELVSLLVEEECDLNIPDTDGDTPLHDVLKLLSGVGGGGNQLLKALGILTASKESCTTIACILASKGADLKRKNKQGKTPLDLCTDSNLRRTLERCAEGQSNNTGSTSTSDKKNSDCKVS